MKGDTPLPFGDSFDALISSLGDDEPGNGDMPLIYVASPLTRAIDQTQRLAVEWPVDKVMSTIDSALEGGQPRYIVHAPAVQSAPWLGDDHTPSDIYQLNTRLLLAEADALITVATNGGSVLMPPQKCTVYSERCS